MPHEIDLSPIAGLGLNLDQYFGLWAVEEMQFLSLFDRVANMNLAAHVQVHGAEATASPKAQVTNARTSGTRETTVGIIDIQGTLTKSGSSLSRASSLVSIRRSIRVAAADEEIDAILLRIDSPGGTVAGTGDVAAEVMAARQKKPVWAYVEDLTASAAYWIASQAEKIFANNGTALVGSIGTMIGLYDMSARAAANGIKAVVIKTGRLKGAGFVGTEITDEQKAYWQEIADKTQVAFTAGVARGRGRTAEQVEAEWMEGRVWNAGDAVTMGLIDGIQSLEVTVAELSKRAAGKSPQTNSRRSAMSQSSTQPTAATINELKAACPGADADFLVAQMEQGATVETSQRAWIAEQNKRLTEAQKKVSEAEARADAQKKTADEAKAAADAAKKAPGVDTLGEGGNADANREGGDPVAEWKNRLEVLVARGMPRDAAVAKLATEDPELREQYCEAVNGQRPKHRGRR